MYFSRKAEYTPISCFTYYKKRKVEYKPHNVHVENIDPRIEAQLLYFLSVNSSLTPEQDPKAYAFYTTIYKALKNKPVSVILEKPLTLLTSLSHLSSNNEFKKIAKINYDKISLRNKIYSDLIEKCEISKLIVQKKMLREYRRLFNFIGQKAAALYDPEIVETLALWHITEHQKTIKKIVMVAGNKHTSALEDYLPLVGYKKIASFQDFVKIVKNEI